MPQKITKHFSLCCIYRGIRRTAAEELRCLTGDMSAFHHEGDRLDARVYRVRNSFRALGNEHRFIRVTSAAKLGIRESEYRQLRQVYIFYLYDIRHIQPSSGETCTLK